MATINLKSEYEVDTKDGVRSFQKLTKSSKDFAKETKKSSDSVSKSGKGLSGVLTTLKGNIVAMAAAAAAAAVGGLALLAKTSISTLDNIGKTADKLGVTTDALQELRFAASQAGVAQRTFDMALQRLSRRVAEAAKGQGELKDTLIEYGIAVKDANGNTRDTEDILDDIADAMSQTTDESERLRIAFKAFDSEGVALVNMLKDGSLALHTLRQEARDLGIVLDETMIRNAAKAADNFDKLWRVIKVQFISAIGEFIPLITDLSEQMLDWIKNNQDLLKQDIPAFVRKIVTSVESLISVIKFLNKVSEYTSFVDPFGGAAKAAYKLAQESKNAKTEIDSLKDSIDDVNNTNVEIDFDLRWAGTNKSLGELLKDPEFLKSWIEFYGKDEIPIPLKGEVTLDEADLKKLSPETFREGPLTKDEALAKQYEFEFDLAKNNYGRLERALDESNLNKQMMNQEFFSHYQENARLAYEADKEAHLQGTISYIENIEARILADEGWRKAFGLGVHKSIQELETFNEVAQRIGQDLNDVWAGNLVGAIEDWAFGVKSAKQAFIDFAQSTTKWILEIIVKWLILKALGFAFGAGGGVAGGLGTALFGGLQSGGTAMAGKPYMVGERGPEMFVPRQTGTVVPNNEISQQPTILENKFIVSFDEASQQRLLASPEFSDAVVINASQRQTEIMRRSM